MFVSEGIIIGGIFYEKLGKLNENSTVISIKLYISYKVPTCDCCFNVCGGRKQRKEADLKRKKEKKGVTNIIGERKRKSRSRRRTKYPRKVRDTLSVDSITGS